jgi:transposase
VKDLFIGIDWGSKSHAVCVVDAQDQRLLEREVLHRGEDVLAFLDQMLQLAGGDLGRVVAAMEAPHGVMVEALLERGVTTYTLNPKQLDRFRDRHSGAGAKDDDLDAYVLATSLRTDRRLFREISIPSAELMALTALSRTYQTLTDHVLAVANQIREQLLRYYPEIRELGAWHEEEWLWHLFEAAPTPARAARLTERRVAGLLQGHHIRRYKAKDILCRLRQRSLPVASGVPEAAAKRIALLLPVLRAANTQRNACSHEMKQLLTSFTKNETDSPEKMHHDAALLLSLPGIGVHNGAVMLTEAYSALQQRDYQALRRLAGVAPVSKRTGGRAHKPHVQQRHACSRRLREAFYHWGRIAARYDPRAHQHYTDLRARGHSRGRAVRGVTDRLIAVLIAMLRTGQPYDPTRRSPPEKIQTVAA